LSLIFILSMQVLQRFSVSFCFIFLFYTLDAQSSKVSTVLAAELNRFEAMTRADTAALKSMLADDLWYVHSNGLTETKKVHLNAIASRKVVYEKMDRESVNVRTYGKTALVNGKLAVRGKLNGNPFELRLFYSAVYRKKHRFWQLVNWQSTKVI